MTKAEIIKLVLGALVVVGIFVGLEYLLSGQQAEKARIKQQLSGSVAVDQLNKRKAEIKEAKRMEKSNAKWKSLLGRVERYFPATEKDALSYALLAGCFPKLTVPPSVTTGDKKTISWTPPKPPESSEGGGSDEAPPAVKYQEQEFTVAFRTTYSGWLEFLGAMEKLGKFYMLKEVTLKSSQSGGTADQKALLIINAKIASYFGTQFPVKAEEGAAAP
ncbi:MAG: hypothetical protein HY815_19650 [Candidatus Riflebacteria bacterium]|nr:hypothetical protein [Candidatus Riflebacteria bacterium]